MSRLQEFSKILYNILNPKPPVVGLGRWASTVKQHHKDRTWFHDSCNQDNCYLDIFKNTQKTQPKIL